MSNISTGNRRKNFLIGRDFQFRISLYFVLVAALCSFCTLFVLMTVHNSNIDFLKSLLPGETNSLEQQIFKNRIILYSITFVFFLVLSSLLFLFGLFFSHRIIGPITRLITHLNSAMESNFNTAPLSLRKRDYLHQVKKTYNLLLFTLHYRNETYIQHSLEVIDDLNRLESMIQRNNPSFSLQEDISALGEEVQMVPIKREEMNKNYPFR